MGLLDSVLGSSIEDPKTQATMAAIQGLLSSPRALGGISQGLLSYGGAMSQAKQQQAQEEYRRMQLQQMALQFQQAQKAAAQQELDQKLTQQAFSPVKSIEANAASGITGPRPEALGVVGRLPAFDPAQFISSGGSAPLAFQLQQSLAKEQPKIEKIGQGEMAGYYKDGKWVQVAANAPKDDTPSAIKEYQFARAQGYPGTYQQFVLEQKRAGATNVKVDTGPKAFDTDLGKFGVDILKSGREGAQAAAGTLESIGQIRQAAQGGAFQGAGADMKLGVAKALGALGMPYDAKTVANSELFSAQANQFVLNSIKGLGANPSNADREFIERTVPRLQTDPAALPALLDFLEGKAKRQIGGYNQQARAAQKSSPFLPFSLEVQEPQTSGGWSIKPKGQ